MSESSSNSKKQELFHKLEKKCDKLAKKNNGNIDKKGFNTICKKLDKKLPVKPTMEETNELFDGIDIFKTEVISKKECMEFVKASIDCDALYCAKLIFRSFDENRTGIIETDEIVKAGQLWGKDITKEDAQAYIEELTGSKTGGFTFPIFCQFFLHYDIPGDVDPYDGRLKKKESSCCILI